MSKIIKFFESCVLEVYKDTNGFPTVGWGHLVKKEDSLKLGDKITQEMADNFLEEDLKLARKRFNLINIELKEYEEEALLSLAYNLSYKSFSKLAKYLNKDKELFKKKMLLYYRDAIGNGQKGLKIRRIAERLLFENREWESQAKKMQKLLLSDILNMEKELFSEESKSKITVNPDILEPKGLEEIKKEQ